MHRTLVIGDIHGGLKALQQVLEKAAVTQSDILIFLGDYVDGWSQSAQVIDFLIELESSHNCIFIKGNHDVWCEEWLRSKKKEKIWLFNGGNETIKSYNGYNEITKLGHLNFLESMRMFYVDTANNLYIHAGFTSMHGPTQEFYNSNYIWDRTLWEMAISMNPRLEKNSVLFPRRLKLYNEIYIGHTPTINYNVDIPMQACNVWNVDTGAAFYGKLSIMDVGTKEYWQSDSVKDFYPDEKGRNKD